MSDTCSNSTAIPLECVEMPLSLFQKIETKGDIWCLLLIFLRVSSKWYVFKISLDLNIVFILQNSSSLENLLSFNFFSL